MLPGRTQPFVKQQTATQNAERPLLRTARLVTVKKDSARNPGSQAWRGSIRLCCTSKWMTFVRERACRAQCPRLRNRLRLSSTPTWLLILRRCQVCQKTAANDLCVPIAVTAIAIQLKGSFMLAIRNAASLHVHPAMAQAAIVSAPQH